MARLCYCRGRRDSSQFPQRISVVICCVRDRFIATFRNGLGRINLLTFTTVQTEVFLLYFLRGAGFLFVAPVFSARSIPPHVKVGLAGVFAYVFLLLNQPNLPQQPFETARFVPMAMGELLIGLSLGFAVGFIFIAFQFAGQIFGFQMGFAIVNVLDPSSEEQVSLVGEFLFAIVSLAFLNLNLHHAMILYFGRSFDIVGAGGISAATFTTTGVEHLVTSLFFLALQIAAPLLAVLFMLDFGLGILARVVPQMNVFIVGMPLKIAGGLFMLALIVTMLDPVIQRTTERVFRDGAEIMRSFGAS